MNGRVYTVAFEAQTIANASGDYDLFEVAPADDKPVVLLGMTLDNVGGAADAGDAQEEMVRLAIVRGNTVSGNGSSATPVPLRPNDGAASLTAETIASTPANTGGSTVLALGWNIRVPLREFWPEELCPVCSQAESRICVRMASTVADDVTVSGTLYLAELV